MSPLVSLKTLNIRVSKTSFVIKIHIDCCYYHIGGQIDFGLICMIVCKGMRNGPKDHNDSNCRIRIIPTLLYIDQALTP